MSKLTMNKVIIAGKADLYSLSTLKNYDFQHYELHLKTIKDFNLKKTQKLLKKTKVISVHQPNNVVVNNQIEEFNILDDGEIGTQSKLALQKTLALCNKLKISKVVLHGAKYNKKTINRSQAYRILKEIIGTMPHHNLLTLETDVLWYTTTQNNQEPLMIFAQDFLEVNKGLNINITLDIEHLIISNLFDEFSKENQSFSDLDKFETKFNLWIRKQTNKKINNVYDQISNFAKQMKAKINHIHINGSDWFNYRLVNSIPLVGEHLPLGYKTDQIQDRLDYKFVKNIIKSLNRPISVVLELQPRNNEYNFWKQMIQSKCYLIERGNLYDKNR